VIELYGSTETGALATRRTASEIAWTPLPGVALHGQGTGEAQRFRAEGPHIDVPIVLGDILELQPDGRFRWLGRASDLVKVGGKRASLFALNLALTQIPGVADGVFSFPPAAGADGESHRARRLAVFFVSETRAPQVIAAAERVDPCSPRPIHRVARPARNASGKQQQAALDELGSTRPRPSPPTTPLWRDISGDPWVPGVTKFARVVDAACALSPMGAG
jgi:acyl-coenzyme A synthetase/AMP-(fatty) acid ligase